MEYNSPESLVYLLIDLYVPLPLRTLKGLYAGAVSNGSII